MHTTYADAGVYDVTVTVTFQAYLTTPDDHRGIAEEAALLMQRGEIEPEIEAEFNRDATTENDATMKAEHYAGF